jgi:hypothetical protein
VEYLVRWRGLSSKFNTWEVEEALPAEVVELYNQREGISNERCFPSFTSFHSIVTVESHRLFSLSSFPNSSDNSKRRKISSANAENSTEASEDEANEENEPRECYGGVWDLKRTSTLVNISNFGLVAKRTLISGKWPGIPQYYGLGYGIAVASQPIFEGNHYWQLRIDRIAS